MAADSIIIIVGAVLLLLVVLNGVGKESSGGLLQTNLSIPLGILGVLLVIYGGYSYGAVNLQGQIEQVKVGNQLEISYPIEKVQVISPLKGDSVQCRILTMGVYPTSHDKDIWVLLRPSDDRYYPQSDHTNTSFKHNGEWQVITRFGGDEGESYDIIVYETDASASEYFSSTIEKWKVSESYPGLELKDIPAGATQVDKIVVSLQENCRGIF